MYLCICPVFHLFHASSSIPALVRAGPSAEQTLCSQMMTSPAIPCLEDSMSLPFPPSSALEFTLPLLVQCSLILRGGSVNVLFSSEHSVVTYPQHLEQPHLVSNAIHYKKRLILLKIQVMFVYKYKYNQKAAWHHENFDKQMQ